MSNAETITVAAKEMFSVQAAVVELRSAQIASMNDTNESACNKVVIQINKF